MPTIHIESDPYILQSITEKEYRIYYYSFWYTFRYFLRNVNLYLIDIFFLLECPYIFNEKYLNCTLFCRQTFETTVLCMGDKGINSLKKVCVMGNMVLLCYVCLDHKPSHLPCVWLTLGFLKWITRRVPLMKQESFILPEHKRNRNCLPFRGTWLHPRCLVREVPLHF